MTDRADELQGLCASMYQIVGQLMFANDSEEWRDLWLPVMDALSAAQNGLPLPDKELLPWSLPEWAEQALESA
jgi:hypothetical protein